MQGQVINPSENKSKDKKAGEEGNSSSSNSKYSSYAGVSRKLQAFILLGRICVVMRGRFVELAGRHDNYRFHYGVVRQLTYMNLNSCNDIYGQYNHNNILQVNTSQHNIRLQQEDRMRK